MPTIEVVNVKKKNILEVIDTAKCPVPPLEVIKEPTIEVAETVEVEADVSRFYTVNAIALLKTALNDLGAYRIVKIIDDDVDYASSDNVTDAHKSFGITRHAVLAGDDVVVLTEGEMENPFWNWLDKPIFLGLNGMLTQTVPDVGFIARIASVLSPTKIYVQVHQCIIIG